MKRWCALMIIPAASSVLLSCGGRRDAAVFGAVLEGERTLLLDIDACNASDNRTEIIETQESVTVAVTTNDPPGGDDCGDVVTIVLAEPLGSRALVDDSTGDVVPVRV